jgi:hypothetical protein
MSILVIESIASVACIAVMARTSQPRPFGWHANFITAEPGGKAAVAAGCPAPLVGRRDRNRRGRDPVMRRRSVSH